MSARLSRKDDDTLTLELGSMSKADFSDALTKIRSIPGRRYNPVDKTNEFPAEIETAIRISQVIQPDLAPEISGWLKDASGQIAEELTTRLPADAKLEIPWGDKLYAYQRSGVAFLVRQPHAVLADEMGLGKTLQAISVVYEHAVFLSNGNDEQGILPSVSRTEPRAHPASEQTQRPQEAGRDQQDNRGRQGSSVRGLRDSTTEKVHGSRPRSGRQTLHAGEVASLLSTPGNLEGAGGSGRDSEVRSALPELSPTPTLPGRCLVVAPNPMRRTWAREIEQWAGEPSVQILDGKNPAARKSQLESGAAWTIVNWEKLRIMPEIAGMDWYAVIADEAHRAKNRKAKQTQALWQIKAPIQLALTGTPIMSAPDDLWAILKWLYPKEYTSYWRFHNMYVDDYEVYFGNRKTRVVTGVKNADKLRFELANKMVRRTKETELDLPPKTWQYIQLDMKPKQAKLYQEIENQLVVDIKQAVKSGTADKDKLIEFGETGDVRTLALVIPNGASRVTRLRQVCSSPALLGDGEPDESAKYDAVEEIIGDNKQKPFVVFCWYKGATELIAERLRKKLKLRAQAMHGDTPDSARDDLKDRFQSGDLDVLVCTISTGGTGLTLTAADTAIFVERDWTPAINMQAADRLHRIGQENPVTLIVLEAAGTVDTGRVGPKNRLKEAIVGQVLGS